MQTIAVIAIGPTNLAETYNNRQCSQGFKQENAFLYRSEGCCPICYMLISALKKKGQEQKKALLHITTRVTQIRRSVRKEKEQ